MYASLEPAVIVVSYGLIVMLIREAWTTVRYAFAVRLFIVAVSFHTPAVCEMKVFPDNEPPAPESMLKTVEAVTAQVFPLESDAVEVNVSVDPAIIESEAGLMHMLDAGPWLTVNVVVLICP